MPSWYLLIHSIPPRPLYLRAKVRQRLERIGAIALKNSVYVLPEGDDALEDFQWLAGEITSGGGEAYITAGRLLAGITDGELIAAFHAARQADYEALVADMRSQPAAASLEKLRVRLAEITAIDFFDSPKRKETERMLERLERKAAKPRGTKAATAVNVSGGTWVTRRGIKIDRIASAWLVRRFIDADARFRFVDPDNWRKGAETTFDMTGGDYSHEGDRCTFETIAAAFGVRDRGIRSIAEIVHDIDLKDEKYGRVETAGIRHLLEGILAANAGDEQRLQRGFALFDDLYASFNRGKRNARS